MGDPKIYTQIELAIQEFIEKYGTDTFILHLKSFSETVPSQDYKIYQKIKMTVCKEFNIPIADISAKVVKSVHGTLANKIITHLAWKHTNLTHKNISFLQKVSLKTIYNHINNVEFMILKPKASYGGFNEKFDNIIKVLGYDRS